MKYNSLLICLLLISIFACNKDEEFIDTLPSCSSDILFTNYPIDIDYVKSFEPLGHYNPPGHVFPTDHHYFNIKRGQGDVDIFAPCDGWITFVVEYDAPDPIQKEYAFELYACKEVWVKYGHITRLDNSILNQLGEIESQESYSTGGVTYYTKNYRPQIEVKAGQKIGKLLDIDGISGMDFGTFDRRVELPFINPSRWDYYGYINTVSFVNYSTSEIKNKIYDIIQYSNEEFPLRTTPPLEGEVCYDVNGTAQGLWFALGKPSYPEDPHLALIRNNFSPEKNVISMGTSVPGLKPIPYEFYTESDGTHNRSFDEITPDGKIYTFNSFVSFWDFPLEEFHFSHDKIILIQLISETKLKIEVQDIINGPPWSFSTNAVEFER